MSINKLIEQSNFSKSDKSRLMKHKEKLKQRMLSEEKNSELSEDQIFVRASNFILEITTFEFIDAMNDLGYENPENFYEQKWLSEIKLFNGDREFHCTMKTLFILCGSQEYLDSSADATALDFLNGNYSEKEAQILRRLGGDDYNCADEIISADKLREMQFESKRELEWCRVRDTAFRLLDTSVFNGVFSCNVYTEMKNAEDIVFFKNKFLDIGFNVDTILDGNDGVNLVIIAQQSAGDFNACYTEQQLFRMIESQRTGAAYFFVATYCDKKIIPAIIKNCYQQISRKLAEISCDTKYVVFDKVTTKTCAYAQVFVTLRAKGFKVDDYEKQFTITW